MPTNQHVMRLIFLASGAFAVPTLKHLAGSGHEVALVVTQPAKASGRGQRVTRTPVAAEAEKLGLAVETSPDVNAPDFVARIRSLGADLGVVIAFGQKLGPAFRETARCGYVNLHASLLPKYRGAAPINWAIIRGERQTGVTVFRIVERMDAGPVLITRSTEIGPEETAGELHDRLAGVGVDAVRATLALFEGGANPPGTPQDDAQATKAPKLSKRDSLVDFAAPVRDIAGRVCGLTPWPGVRADFESDDGRWEHVTLCRARRAETPDKPTIEPGDIDRRLFVAAGDGFLEILELKPSSGRLMTWREFVNGRHVKAGDRLVTPEAKEE